jgi:hypothetical protein
MALTPAAVEKLIVYRDACNPNPDFQGILDRTRWYAFVIQANLDKCAINEDEVDEVLRKGKNWNEYQAMAQTSRYRYDRELLSANNEVLLGETARAR